MDTMVPIVNMSLSDFLILILHKARTPSFKVAGDIVKKQVYSENAWEVFASSHRVERKLE